MLVIRIDKIHDVFFSNAETKEVYGTLKLHQDAVIDSIKVCLDFDKSVNILRSDAVVTFKKE